jgi:hypothetical protein
MSYLEPICPAIVYSTVYNGIDKQKLLNKLLMTGSSESFFNKYADQQTYKKIEALSNYAEPDENTDKYESIDINNKSDYIICKKIY